MKILTNRRNKNAIRASNNQVVFYKNQVWHKAVTENEIKDPKQRFRTAV